MSWFDCCDCRTGKNRYGCCRPTFLLCDFCQCMIPFLCTLRKICVASFVLTEVQRSQDRRFRSPHAKPKLGKSSSCADFDFAPIPALCSAEMLAAGCMTKCPENRGMHQRRRCAAWASRLWRTTMVRCMSNRSCQEAPLLNQGTCRYCNVCLLRPASPPFLGPVHVCMLHQTHLLWSLCDNLC